MVFTQADKGRVVFLDGAMGTQLQARGLGPGEEPELWNLTKCFGGQSPNKH